MKPARDNCLVIGMTCDRCGILTKQPRFHLTGSAPYFKTIVLCPRCEGK